MSISSVNIKESKLEKKTIINEKSDILPFLKWAGGKRWLVKKHSRLFPNKYNRYFEPFLGSAAVFFYLQPEKSFLSDKNEELINSYQAIRDDWEKVFRNLKIHQKNHSHEYYYSIRAKRYSSVYKEAARFIYLNRSCWNGLYRVNLKGEFNVPKGTKENIIYPTDDFPSISKILQNSEIFSKDFEEIIDLSDKDDLIFVDPPYTVMHNNNGFIKYNKKLFSWEDQIRLCNSLKRAMKRGAKIIITNAAHSSIKTLYEEDFHILSIQRNSIIAANSEYRNKCYELIIRSNNVIEI